MGYEVYYSETNSRWQGYGVPAYCDHPECKAVIDRGMGYVCCDNQNHTESCGGFYCEEHKYQLVYQSDLKDMSNEDINRLGICSREEKAQDRDGIICCTHKPIESKEHPDWLKHVLKDSSWLSWRKENPETVASYKTMLHDCKNKFAKLSRLVAEARKIGAEACKDVDDMVGSMNLDRLMLCGLSGVREVTLQKSGISCDKKSGCSGTFWLNMSFGSANKNTAGLEAAREYLRKNGVDCYIHYQMD